MTLRERAEWTKAKIDESCKQGEDAMTIRYWVGYLDGLIAALTDQRTEAERALADAGKGADHESH